MSFAVAPSGGTTIPTVIAATDPALLARCPERLRRTVRSAEPAATLFAAVAEVLRRSLRELSGEHARGEDVEQLPHDVRRVPVLLAADDYCVDMATVFVRRCHDRTLRPSDSIGLETSELLRRFAHTSGWRGPGHVLVTVGRAAEQAVRLGDAMVRLGTAVVVCELLATRAPDPAAPPRRPLGPYLVVAQALTGRRTGVEAPAEPATGDPFQRSVLLRGFGP